MYCAPFETFHYKNQLFSDYMNARVHLSHMNVWLLVLFLFNRIHAWCLDKTLLGIEWFVGTLSYLNANSTQSTPWTTRKLHTYLPYPKIWWWKLFFHISLLNATRCQELSQVMYHPCGILVLWIASGDDLSHPCLSMHLFVWWNIVWTILKVVDIGGSLNTKSSPNTTGILSSSRNHSTSSC